MRTSFVDGATIDFDQSFEFYQRSSPPTAQRFAVAVFATLDKVAEDPERFLSIGRGQRSCSVAGFPFQIIYRFDAHEFHIQVIAVAHAKRCPGYWNERA